MDGAKPPVQVAVDFIAHTKWHLLLHAKNQAICHKAFLVLEQIQMFEPWSRPRRPHHVSFHLRILSSCPEGDSLILVSRRSPGRPESRNRRSVDWVKPKRTGSSG